MPKTRVPALGAEGWFTEDGADGPALVGSRCTSCGNVAFPAATFSCRNPSCAGSEFDEARLARTGTVWSVTDARYQPPAPYVPPAGEHVPFAIAAVELAGDQLVVLGQVVSGVAAEDLKVGSTMELVVDTLFEDDDHEYTIWKWRPANDG
jgi:uncharacterized OB-fold protein